MSPAPSIYAIDFGTTNSLIAAANAERTWEPLAIDAGSHDATVLRSILFFPEDKSAVLCGSAALRGAAESGMRGRLIRSIKRFLPAASFTETRIGSRRYALEELVAIVLRTLRESANRALDADVRAAVIGRPARFSDDPEADALAARRLVEAARLAGFNEVSLCEEPVAAALDCADETSATELVAVCDLGGGTSDFTVARLGAGRSDVLAVGGVALAGDALDGALMRDHISPYFGSRVSYRMPFGENVLTFPKPLLEKMCSPAELALLDRRDVLEFLRTMKSFALSDDDRERMERLLCLVEDRLGFSLFEAIDRLKRELSTDTQAAFRFEYPGIDIEQQVSRSGFETAAQGSIERIVERFEETLRAAKIEPTKLDRVYLTGGTAQVPALISAVGERVGAHKLSHVRTFHAVIQGLAHRARELARNGAAQA
ncbi:MAG: Hsp70 family protein [Myxococcota bacterium]